MMEAIGEENTGNRYQDEGGNLRQQSAEQAGLRKSYQRDQRERSSYRAENNGFDRRVKTLADITHRRGNHAVDRPGQHVACGLEFGERRSHQRPEYKADADDEWNYHVTRQQTDDEVEARREIARQVEQAGIVDGEKTNAANPVHTYGLHEDNHEQRQHRAIDEHTTDHGEVLIAGGAFDFATDLGRPLSIANHEKHPGQHE